MKHTFWLSTIATMAVSEPWELWVSLASREDSWGPVLQFQIVSRFATFLSVETSLETYPEPYVESFLSTWSFPKTTREFARNSPQNSASKVEVVKSEAQDSGYLRSKVAMALQSDWLVNIVALVIVMLGILRKIGTVGKGQRTSCDEPFFWCE